MIGCGGGYSEETWGRTQVGDVEDNKESKFETIPEFCLPVFQG